ncbi:MAG: hypothetical protein O3C43_22350 [Verrucomicrobia bacterium]|nr:hypothetical protein [Verrucomicrobiota bacterium]MDA1069234.1 hypothetical protein [Verrucomicrobiota bacterium]
MQRKRKNKKALPTFGLLRFDEYAGARAWNETRVLTVKDPGFGLPPGEFAFVEFYCADPSCDCRRVVLQVWSKDTLGQSLASISYGWEDEAFYTEWNHGDAQMGRDMKGPELEFFQPQSNLADKLLHQFKETIMSDKAYLKRLETHYAFAKEKQTVKPRKKRKQ